MKKINNKKAIGILGGMGPQASLYMQSLLFSLAISKYKARNNQDFPEILSSSVPIPDFISSNKNRLIALNMLKQRTKNFNIKSTLCLSIACNTAHMLITDIQNQTNIPIVSMINEVTSEASRRKYKKVGILATPFTIRHNLYQDSLKKEGIDFIVPSLNQLLAIESVIRKIISGDQTHDDSMKILRIATDLHMRGAQAIILGCTEIPLVFPKEYPIPVLNSVEILCLTLLKKYYEQNLSLKGGDIYD